MALTLGLTACSLPASAQNSVGDDQATPLPGRHNYIEGLSETVTPSNGQVSVRINVPLPAGRGLNVPFAVAYDSSGMYHMADSFYQTTDVYGNKTYSVALDLTPFAAQSALLTQGGWTYTVPQAAVTSNSVANIVPTGPTAQCAYTSNYIFIDPSGARHALGLGWVDPSDSIACNALGNQAPPHTYNHGGDGQYQAVIDNYYSVEPPPLVADNSGTVYQFHGNTIGLTANASGIFGITATMVEDRNGNELTIANSNGALSYTDTASRKVLATSGFAQATDTLTVSGLSNPYKVSWSQVSSSTPPAPSMQLGTSAMSSFCTSGAGVQAPSYKVVKTITLPNGDTYTFLYAQYGLLTRITYPTGAYVNYTWAPNKLSEIANYAANGANAPQNAQPGCQAMYDTYSIKERDVSYDGSTVALTQAFTYTTDSVVNSGILSWDYKTTKIVETDNLRQSSRTTMYTYKPMPVPDDPNNNAMHGTYAAYYPVESQIQYGTTETVIKNWFDPASVSCEVVTLDGSSKGNFYASYSVIPTEIRDYDYGSVQPSDCQNYSGSAFPSAGVLKDTTITYQAFSATPIFPARPSLLAFPQSISVSGAGGNSSVTKYYYDNPASIKQTQYEATQHDDPNYSSSNTANRGNVTSSVRTVDSSHSITTYEKYDDTGNVLTSIDGRGNTTSYSYNDSFTVGGPPQYTTYAYLSSITKAATGSIAHVSTFSYDYTKGLLTTSVDENSQKTTYSYVDQLGRLKDIYAPASVQNSNQQPHTHYDYTDGTNPSITITDPDGVQSETFFDGFGRQRKTELTNSAGGVSPVYTNTAYDGTGLVWTKSNPTLCDPDATGGCVPQSTDGQTKYTYDEIGRLLNQENPDQTNQFWSYSGNTTTFTNESKSKWLKAIDGSGNLVKVEEPDSSGNPSIETDYVYDALGNLKSVVQNGAAGDSPRIRTFSYDNLSRLLTAANPETGVVCYGTWSGSSCVNGYDGNGNLVARTDARSRSTYFEYDALNRLVAKTYSDSTPSACYQYDLAARSGTTLNLVGHLAAQWTQAGACPTSVVSSFPASIGSGQAMMQYDAMGRLLQEFYCTPQMCNFGGSVSAQYDLAGNMTNLDYPDGRHLLQSFDAAGRWSGVGYNAWNTTPESANYLTVNTFDPAGRPTSVTIGSPSSAAMGIASSYDNRERMSALGYTSPTGSLWSRSYSWTPDSNLQSYTDPVAKVTRQFGYDTLNRLTSAQDVLPSGVAGSGQGDNSSDESASNVLYDSQALNSGGWSAYNGVLTSNVVAAPDGTLTAGKIVANSGSNDSYASAYVLRPLLYDGAQMTGSVWLRVPTGALTTHLSIINVNSQGQHTAGDTVVTLDTNWKQYTVSGTNQNGLALLGLYIGENGTFTSGEIDIWGAELTVAAPTTTATNLIPYSQQIGGANWAGYCSTSMSNVGLNDKNVAAPDGTYTATHYTMPSSMNCGSATGPFGSLNNSFNALMAAQTYTMSIWLRGAVGGEVVNLGLNDCFLSPVTLSTSWQRFSVTYPSISAANASCSGNSRGFEFRGNTPNENFYAWGAQLENASTAGQYVATLDSLTSAEENSTNILPSSGQINGPGWAIIQGTPTLNAYAAPDGSMTADLMTSNSGSSSASITDYATDPSLFDSATVTASVYLCVPSGSLTVPLSITETNSSGTSNGSSYQANLNTVWQRFELTRTVDNGLSKLGLTIGGNGSITNGQGIEIWGAQMVTGNMQGTYTGTSSTTSGGSTLATNGLNESYAYDAFGNMTSSGNFNFVQAYTSANQLSGWQYDQSGNLQIDAFNNLYSYDAEGRISSQSGGPAYVYDANGDRVGKTGGLAIDYIYFGGKQIARYSGGQWTDLIYGPTGLLAEVAGNPTALPVYRILDHLGTQVGTVDNNGQLLSLTDYAPFGQVFTGGTSDPYMFTGKERDTESGNDYFGARYYASSMGRWLSPDRMNLTDDRVLNPANTLNKYIYGGDNPLKYIDPDGKDITVFYENTFLSFPGHIMFVAENQRTGDAAAMSWGPVRDSEYSFTAFGGKVNSTKEFGLGQTTDELKTQFSSLTIRTSPEDAQEIITFIRQMSTSSNPYTLYGPNATNCTTVCRNALRAIRAISGNNQSWTPADLWGSLFSHYSPSYWQNPFAQFLPARGTDYGIKPSNYDPFHLLELLTMHCTDSWSGGSNTLTSGCN